MVLIDININVLTLIQMIKKLIKLKTTKKENVLLCKKNVIII